MKKIVLLFAFIFAGLMASYSQDWTRAAGSTNATLNADAEGKVEWKTTSMDLGQIPQNVPKKAEFEVKNTGKKPIIISKVTAGCGCTKVEWPKEPILPGKSASVSTIFNAAGMGKFSKTVTVYLSDDVTQVLSFNGEVIAQK